MSQHQNADLEYILDLFDKEELKLTISEDTEEAERTSKAFDKDYNPNPDIRDELSEARYRHVFSAFFKHERQEAIGFIDAAIKFMGAIKKVKVEAILTELSKGGAFDTVMNALTVPEMLVEPIQDEIDYGDLGEKDMQRYKEAMGLLKGQGELTVESKQKIQQLLTEVEAQ